MSPQFIRPLPRQIFEHTVVAWFPDRATPPTDWSPYPLRLGAKDPPRNAETAQGNASTDYADDADEEICGQEDSTTDTHR
jgi:hypothetical protein